MGFKKFWNNIKSIELGYKLLILFLVVFILPLILFGVISYQNMKNTLQSNAIDYNNDKIMQVNESIDAFFSHLDSTINSLEADYNFINQIVKQESDFESTIDYINRDESINNTISNILIENKDLESVYVYVDKADSFYLNFHSSIDTDYSPKEEGWYKKLASGEIGKLLLPKTKDKQSSDSTTIIPYVGIIEPSVKVDSELPKMIIQMNITPDFASGFLANLTNDSTEMYILDAHNSIIANTANASIEDFEFVRQELDSENGVNLDVDYEDKHLLVSHISNKNSSLTVVAISNNSTVMDASEDYKMILILFTIAMFTLFIIVSVVISIGVSKPLKNLESIIYDVEMGNLETIKQEAIKGSSWLMAAHFNHYILTINELLKQINDHIAKQYDQEMKILQSQINPHFIYNTLNTIKWLARLEENERTEEGITSLIQLLKSTIKFGHNFVSIKEEIQQINDYIKIQRLRYDDSFSVEIDVDESIKKYKTLKFMLQPILENAIFHGIDHERKDGKITIEIKKTDNDILYSIKDNGCGMNKKKVKRIVGSSSNNAFTGIGIQNVSERIKKYFGEDYGIDIVSKEGQGTTVSAKIPAILYKKDKQ